MVIAPSKLAFPSALVSKWYVASGESTMPSQFVSTAFTGARELWHR